MASPSLPRLDAADPSARRPLRHRRLRLLSDQRVAFVLVGGVNTAFGAVCFVAFHLTIGQRVGYMVTLAAAHVTAVLVAFLLHRYLVFKVRGHFWLDLARFEMVNLSAIVANAVLLPLCVELAGIGVVPSQLLITALTVTLTYLAHRQFSFRRRRPGPAAARPEVRP